jgi:hypothetical protein
MSTLVSVAAIQSPTDYIQKIYEDALFVARDNNLMMPLVTMYTGSGLAPRISSEYGTATINSISDTDDLASQAFTPATLATLTPAEVGAQFLLTDTRVESDPFGVAADASRELGLAVASKMERDLLGVFSSLTGGTVGAAGTVITWNHVAEMQSRLRAGNVPGPYEMVLHPYQWHQLAKAATLASGAAQVNAPDFQNAAQAQWFVSRSMGVDFYVSSNITVDGSDDAYCAMFNRAALAIDIRRAPRLEPQRDASRRATELNISAIYGYGVWRPRFGVKGIFDARVTS